MFKISQKILDLRPYSPGKPIEETQREYNLTEVHKLAGNENPMGVSEPVKSAILGALGHLNRYPDPSCFELAQAYAKKFGLSPQNLMFGNGSNEIIDLLIRVLCEPGDKVLTSKYAFIAYKICGLAARAEVLEAETGEDFKISAANMAQMVQQYRPKVVFIPNPNNPIGSYLNQVELDEVLGLATTHPETLFVVDEAYNEYVRAGDFPEVMDAFRDNGNVAVLRTMSKAYGLAGLRVGALIAHEEVLSLVNRIRNPFNVNTLAQVAATAALQDDHYLEKSVRLNTAEMQRLEEELTRLGFKVYPSQANFILVKPPRLAADEVAQALLTRGVIVRPLGPYGLGDHLRVSVGSPSENAALLTATQEVLGG